MRFKTRKLVLVVLVGFFFVIWRGHTDHDVAVAQGRKAVVITRIYTGPDGLAHAEDIELKLNARGATDMLKATGAELSVRPPTPGANPRNTAASDPSAAGWHTGPHQGLHARIDIEAGIWIVGAGKQRSIEAGEGRARVIVVGHQINSLDLPGQGGRLQIGDLVGVG